MRKNRALLLLPALLVLLALTLSGCKDFSFYGVLGDRIDDTPLQISPAAVSVAEGGTLTFTATGGKPPYSFSVFSGPGSFVAGTGDFAATTSGAVTVRVTDTRGRRSDAEVTVNPSGSVLTISPGAPPFPVSMGPGGKLTFVASGGTAPYTFILTASGSGLPKINDGGIPGAYVAGASTGTDTIQVQDSALPAATATATVNVTAAMVTVNYSLDEASFNFPANGAAGSGVPIGASFRIQNALLADGTEPISWWVYLSDDGTLGSGDTLLDAGSRGPLAAGSWADVTFSGTWPLSSGLKYLFASISAADDLEPADNISAAHLVTVSPPDVNYSVTAVTNTGELLAGGSLSGSFTLGNAGSVAGSQSIHWAVYVSPDDVWDISDTLVASDTRAPLGPFPASVTIPFSGAWPPAHGARYLLVKVTAVDDLPAGGKTGVSGLITVTRVDYTVTNVTHLSGAKAGAPFTARFTVTNTGDANGVQNLFWNAYVSYNNSILGPGDTLVASQSLGSGLNAGISQVVGPFAGAWPYQTGDWYIIITVSAADELPAQAADNQAALGLPVAVGSPNVDYDITPASGGGVSYAGGIPIPTGALNGNCTFKNTGTNNGTQTVSYMVYASLDQILDVADYLVASGSTSPLDSSVTSVPPVSFSGTWPLVFGDYYLIVRIISVEDMDVSDNTGVTTTTTAVGIFVESEPNGFVLDASQYNDLAGIVMRPGMRVKVTGSLTWNPQPQDLDDYFRMNTGTANTITASLVLASGTQDLGIFYYQARGVFAPVPGYGITNVNNITIAWPVDVPNVFRYIDAFNAGSKNCGPYTMIISAD